DGVRDLFTRVAADVEDGKGEGKTVEVRAERARLDADGPAIRQDVRAGQRMQADGRVALEGLLFEEEAILVGPGQLRIDILVERTKAVQDRFAQGCAVVNVADMLVPGLRPFVQRGRVLRAGSRDETDRAFVRDLHIIITEAEQRAVNLAGAASHRAEDGIAPRVVPFRRFADIELKRARSGMPEIVNDAATFLQQGQDLGGL